MKLTKILLVAGILGTSALFAQSALASPGQIAASATIRYQKTNGISGKAVTSATITTNWTIAKIYGLISNAVATMGTNVPGVAATNFPANGYIAYTPAKSDGNVTGIFYVTNKTGFYYPLSGVDTSGNYYSFMELDTYLGTTDDSVGSGGLIDLGFSDNFNGVETGSYNTSTEGGSESVVASALFYVHDNPYAFDGGNNPNAFYGNNNAFELQGMADVTISYKKAVVSNWVITLHGSGNAVVAGSQNAVATSGSLSVTN